MCILQRGFEAYMQFKKLLYMVPESSYLKRFVIIIIIDNVILQNEKVTKIIKGQITFDVMKESLYENTLCNGIMVGEYCLIQLSHFLKY